MILCERRGIAALPARMLLGSAQTARRAAWAVTRRRSTGSRAICLTPDGDVVLVRHSYMRGWFLPGGGPRRGEDAAAALVRELREEIGLWRHGRAESLFTVTQRAYAKRDRQTVFLIRSASIEPRLSLEIEAIGAFPLDRLPPLPPSTRYKLDRWRDPSRNWASVPVPEEP